MKNYKSLLFTFFLAVGILGFSSCKDNATEPVEEQDDKLEITVIDISDESDFVFYEADEDSKLVLCPYSPSEEYIYIGSKQRKGGKGHLKHDEWKKRGLGHHKEYGEKSKYGSLYLKKVFVKMDLTEDQIILVQSLYQEHKDCVKESRAALYDTLKVILDSANIQRDSIMADLEAEVITKEEASLKLKELNAATREQIANSEAMKTAIANLKKCREDFLANIRLILTEEQVIIWDEYILELEG